MKKLQRYFHFSRSTFTSLAVHAIFLGLIALFAIKFPERILPAHFIEIEVLKQKTAPAKIVGEEIHKIARSDNRQAKTNAKPTIDLRPEYMKHPLFGKADPAKTLDANKPFDKTDTENSALTVANALPHVTLAFDHLAATIDRNLDYPDLLVEHNVQGTAVLNLHFDNEGKVNESESNFTGSHVAIRGLLVRAVRSALVEWYQSDAYRLKRDQFKGQTFRAVFDVSYVAMKDTEKLTKEGANHYEMTREKFKNECVYPGSVDFLCTALKVEGAIENAITDASRIKFELLKDKLSSFDDLGLNGINQLIRGT